MLGQAIAAAPVAAASRRVLATETIGPAPGATASSASARGETRRAAIEAETGASATRP